MIPIILKKLMEDLKKLPGIGNKTAERHALFLADMKDEDITQFAEHLLDLKNLKKCNVCHVLSDTKTCEICSNSNRDKTLLMVVSDSKDVFLMEKTNNFQGNYHVLDGLIDFSRGVTKDDLNVDDLLLKANNVKEVILATNGTIEGEVTAQYIKKLLEDKNITTTRLAYGLPVGADLKYADELTLIKAIENRQKY